MRNLSLAFFCCIAVLQSGCDAGHGHSHGPDGSHAQQSAEPQQPADQHKSID